MSSNLFFQGMMYLTTLIYGGYLIAMGQMQAADLAMYALYIGIFISPIQILVELVEMLQKGLSGFRRYLEVVETEPEIQDKEGAIDLENVKGDVCYDNVSFHYSDDNKTVLSQVSIHIPAGKSVALVGPSGGGKTTICSLLPRFYDVTAGKVTIDGKDVRDLTLKSLRNQIGMVQQDVYLFDGTIRENIAYGKPDATDEEIKEAARRANMDDFIMQLPEQYDTYVGEKGTRLSGGQKQRISIARVFLKNPPILILDEATSALDNESERYIQKSLEELAKTVRPSPSPTVSQPSNVPTKSLSSQKMALPSAVHTKLYLQKRHLRPLLQFIIMLSVLSAVSLLLKQVQGRQNRLQITLQFPYISTASLVNFDNFHCQSAVLP